MKHYDLLIIGGVAAGMSAASQARRNNKDISIGVFEKGAFVSYGACGMPYYIDNLIPDHKQLIAIDVNKFINERNIQIFMDSEAIKIDFSNKQVEVKRKDNNETYSYNKLVIATGARAILPPIKGIESKNVFALRSLTEGIAIKNFVQTNKPERGVIIGGGPIGLEMAESLRTMGVETILLEKMKNIAASFDDEVRSLILQELEKNKVAVRTGADIKEIRQEGNGLSISVDNEKLPADFIIVSTGIRPNTEFLNDTGLKMNDRGAVVVNEKSETNIPGVYSAGDCATVKHLILNQDVYMPLGTTSNKQGRVAGLQAVGIDTEQFKGIVGSQLIKVFDLELGKTGLSESEAERSGIKAESSVVQGKSRAGYYPGAKNILIKITINSDSREIIGGQTAGAEGAASRVNILATAIASKMKVEDFAYLDLGYAPPFSPVWDGLLAAAQNLVKR
jgi:NADPH-dependent 2,4-dienoyl-CoA reductase/sulfur reductase-like enzyme